MSWLKSDELGMVEEPPLDLSFLSFLTRFERYSNYVLVGVTLLCVVGIAMGGGR